MMARGVLNMVAALLLLCATGPLTRPHSCSPPSWAESYFAAMLIAPAFPDMAWSDPEFDDVNPRPLEIPIQQLLGLMATGLVAIAVLTALMG